VLATCGEDCYARLWDTERGTFKGPLQGHKVPIRWAAFSEDGHQLVTASPDRTVLLWDVPSLSLIRTVPVSGGSRLRSFAVSADLSRAVQCKWDSTVKVVDLQTGEQVSVLQKWGERDSATGHTSAVNQVLMTQDGQTVVTLSKDCTARVWDASTGACRHVLTGHTDSVLGGCIADAARLLATFGFDDCVRLWALDSGQCINCVKLPDTPQMVALSPDGWKVAVALTNASVVVLDVDDKAANPPWEFHSADITGLQFTADGAELVSVSMDASVCVWDAATGMPTGLFVGDCGFTCCWMDGCLDQLAVGTDRGIVHALDLGVTPRGMAGAPLAGPNAQAAAAAALAGAVGGQHRGVPAVNCHAGGIGAAQQPAAPHAPAGHAGPHPALPPAWQPGMPLPQQLPAHAAAGHEQPQQLLAPQPLQAPPSMAHPQQQQYQPPPQQQQQPQDAQQPADVTDADVAMAAGSLAAKLTVGAT
jgi:WD40 repeat protein